MKFFKHIVLLAVLGETEIADFPLVAEPHDVGGLEVSVDDVLGHEMLVAVKDLPDDGDGLVFSDVLLELDKLAEVAVGAVLGD